MQLRELREYCARRGFEIVAEYVDQGISGTKERGPQLDKLWMDAKRRKFDAVVVYRYDRFARSLRQLVNALEEFRGPGIDFISLHEGVDTATPNGRLVFGIFASIAEFERELIRDRVRSGIASARAKGKRIGRPAADPALVSQVRTMVSSGQSLRLVRRWALALRRLINIQFRFSRSPRPRSVGRKYKRRIRWRDATSE